ncbi:MAG: hypothetical protein L3J59_09800 [Methylococcaceae bacterium]|nr:hypothetical protein [Methylococcaceae bacterium]
MIILKYRVELLLFLTLFFIIFPLSVLAEEVTPVDAVKPIDKKVLPVNTPAKDRQGDNSNNDQNNTASPVAPVIPSSSASADQQQTATKASSTATPETALSATDPMKAKPSADLKMNTMTPKMAVKLEDPTRISDSFQSALKRLGPQVTDTPGATTPAAVTVLPDIELAGIIDGYGKERTALIKLGKKTHMVREGYTFTEIKGNVVLEIYVEKIELCEIKLNVSPPNQLLILR